MAQTAPNNTSNLSVEELERKMEADRQTKRPWYERVPVPNASQVPHQHSKQAPAEKRFSHWSYRHTELHALGVIDELLLKSDGKGCCSGVYIGECRVSKVNMRAWTAFVDGNWCPMQPETKVAVLDTLTDITDGDEEIAVVCASKSEDTKACQGVITYCVGTKPPKA